MKSFEYGDEEIGRKEIMFLVFSSIVALSILTLPRELTKATQSSDGWIPLLIASIIALPIVWVGAKLPSLFPNKTFFEYTGLIATKPVSYFFTFLFVIYYQLYTSWEIRGIANVSKHYLFERTPIEVVSLIFLLVVSYAVSGSRSALMRLNLIFVGIALTIGFTLMFTGFGFFELQNLKPLFVAGWMDILTGVDDSAISLLGSGSLLFYVAFMNQPKDAPKAALAGMSIVVIFYLLVYIVVIGVSGVEATLTTVYPTIELAKEIEVPGEFFERIESIFFVIWIIKIFITTALFFDLTLIALGSMFPQVRKITWIIVLSPLMYLVSMLPQNLVDFSSFSTWLGYISVVMEGILPILLLFIARLRGLIGHG